LKGALVKIAGVAQGSRIVEADAEQAAHMLFAPGLSRLFATHPPLAERIRELDPHFDVKQLPRQAAQALAAIPAFDAEELEQARVARVGAASAETLGEIEAQASGTGAISAAPVAGSVAVKPQTIASQVGAVDTIHIEQAKALRLALPAELREFIESSGQAHAIVLALLLSSEPTVRERQLAMLEKNLPVANLGAVRDASPLAEDLPPMLRLPALLQVFPALRRLPIAQRQSLARLAENLIRADARIDVFEFCLARLLGTLLRDEIEARAPHGNVSLAEAADDIQVLFAVLATFGAKDEREARMAYEAGMQSVLPMVRPAYAALDDWPRRLSQSLLRLEKLHPFAKKAVIEGLVKTIAHDDLLNVSEAELLRTICATLHCPLPPLLPESVGQG
jgi:hypothetical protein